MNKNELFVFLEDTLSGLGYELVDFQQSLRKNFRLFIDAPGGITVDDCASVSRHMTKLFLVKGIDYSNLEVSSPGLDRLLRKPSDFLRFVDSLIKVTLSQEILSNEITVPKNFTAKLLGFDLDENLVTVEMDGYTLSIPVVQIQKVRLVPEV